MTVLVAGKSPRCGSAARVAAAAAAAAVATGTRGLTAARCPFARVHAK